MFDVPQMKVEAVSHIRRWRFPTMRFVHLDERDERWCRYFGVGEEVQETQMLTIENAVPRFNADGSWSFCAVAKPDITLLAPTTSSRIQSLPKPDPDVE